MLPSASKKVDSQVASGDVPRRVDALQTSTGQGPCLDAAYKERVVRVPDLSREDRWPKFSLGAVELGARSMLSFQSFVESDRLGALNPTVTARKRSTAIPSRSGVSSQPTPPWLSRTPRRLVSSMKPWYPGN